MSDPSSKNFGLFLSCVPGRLVRRHGTGSHIGATITVGGGAFDETVIVPISNAELARFDREYRKSILAGDVRKRTGEEFDAFVADQLARSKQVMAELEANSEPSNQSQES